MSRYNTQNLRSYPRVSAKEPTSRTAISVKVPISHHKAWMTLPSEERNELLRNTIAQTLIAKNLIDS